MKATATRLDPLLAQPRRHGADRRLIEGEAYGPVDVDALRHGEAQAAGHQRLRLVDEDVVLIVAPFVGNLDHVAEALGRDEGGPCPLALDDGVGGERRAVQEHREVGEAETCPLEHQPRAGNDRLLRRARRGEDLGAEPPLADLDHDIREGAADVDREARRKAHEQGRGSRRRGATLEGLPCFFHRRIRAAQAGGRRRLRHHGLKFCPGRRMTAARALMRRRATL